MTSGEFVKGKHVLALDFPLQIPAPGRRYGNLASFLIVGLAEALPMRLIQSRRPFRNGRHQPADDGACRKGILRILPER